MDEMAALKLAMLGISEACLQLRQRQQQQQLVMPSEPKGQKLLSKLEPTTQESNPCCALLVNCATSTSNEPPPATGPQGLEEGAADWTLATGGKCAYTRLALLVFCS